MKYGIFNLFLFVYLPVFSQQKGDKTIIVKGVSFMEVCTNLLDKGYSIDKKDTELQTVKTEETQYPKFWNAKYRINVRVKDSVAYISGTFEDVGADIFRRGLCLPSDNKMTPEQQDRIIEIIHRCFR